LKRENIHRRDAGGAERRKESGRVETGITIRIETLEIELEKAVGNRFRYQWRYHGRRAATALLP
jgi:hypothetical protein